MQRALPRGARKQVRAANHCVHALRSIIHDHRQLIGDESIAATDHGIAEQRSGVRLRSLEAIDELDALVCLEREARGAGARGCATNTERAAWTRRRRRFARGPDMQRELAARAATFVGETGAAQPLERVVVSLGARVLMEHRLIVLQTEHGERSQDVVGHARHAARGIEVFHAQQPAAAVCAGIEPAREGGNE